MNDFLGGTFRPQNSPTVSSKLRSSLWLRRCLPINFKASKASSALAAGIMALPG
jgi:hypothetical protein